MFGTLNGIFAFLVFLEYHSYKLHWLKPNLWRHFDKFIDCRGIPYVRCIFPPSNFVGFLNHPGDMES